MDENKVVCTRMVAFKVGRDKWSDFGDIEGRAERCSDKIVCGCETKMHSSIQDGSEVSLT